MDTLFSGVFDTVGTTTIEPTSFIACIMTALFLGLIIAMAYTVKTKYSKSFLATLALLPAVVCVVIMMVNGNVGAGVAVAGAFSLVRFRSVPGTAKEIITIFLAMGSGLIAGMGYLAYAVLYTLILVAFMILYNIAIELFFKEDEASKALRITIPEDLEFNGAFDDLFNEYTKSHSLDKVKTTNMGSMYKLYYTISMSDPSKEKEFIDKLRCRNGNLEISIAKIATEKETL